MICNVVIEDFNHVISEHVVHTERPFVALMCASKKLGNITWNCENLCTIPSRKQIEITYSSNCGMTAFVRYHEKHGFNVRGVTGIFNARLFQKQLFKLRSPHIRLNLRSGQRLLCFGQF